MTEMR